MLSALYKLAFRMYRCLRGRDDCETCDGKTNVRGNENVVNGVVMCDDCSVRYDRPKCDRRTVVKSIRGTVALNRGFSSQTITKAMEELADAIERGDTGRP